jgi:polyhydroxybutyrate depolymerase
LPGNPERHSCRLAEAADMLACLMTPFARLIFKGFAAAVFAAPIISFSSAATIRPAALGPGDHFCPLTIGGLNRSYLVHVPKGYDSTKPQPVVLALHGMAMTGSMMVSFAGLNETSEKNNFIVVYPNGTGFGPLQTWNAGGLPPKMANGKPDDVEFIGKVLDDLSARTNVDAKRVYACGMSNGAMMCYRLAAEMSDRIAAIAPVAGTVAITESHPKRPVPVLHFHGNADPIVPFRRATTKPSFMKLSSVDESIQTWVKLDGCDEKPSEDVLSKDGDEMKVTRQTYGGGKDGSEVVLVTIQGGGHTWPGQKPPVEFIGKSAMNLSADDLICEFFQKHPMK